MGIKVACDFLTIKAGKRANSQNPITNAFLSLKQGIQASDFEWSDCNGDLSDVVFVFGSITKRKPDTERAQRILKHRIRGKKIFALDSALFSTYIRNHNQSSETGMFRIGLNDITGEGDFRNKGLGSERFEWFKSSFGFSEKKPTGDYNKPILFLMQSEKGWQYDNHQPYWQWARDQIESIRKQTDRKIILRGHPNMDRVPISEVARGFSNISTEQSERTRISLLQSLSQAGTVVTHSSSGACEAIVEGIPTIALDKRCVVYDACLKNLDSINEIESFDWKSRNRHLNEWAWSSWQIDEMKDPNIINHLIQGI